MVNTKAVGKKGGDPQFKGKRRQRRKPKDGGNEGEMTRQGTGEDRSDEK